jgi:hypothetical protein
MIEATPQAWVDEIYTECLKLRSALLTKRALDEAAHYTSNMWSKLQSDRGASSVRPVHGILRPLVAGF